MTIRNWLNCLRSPPLNRRSKRAQRNAGRKKPPCPLTLTSLEDRTVPAFLGPTNYAAGGYHHDVVAALINNDSILDLATVNYYDSTVSVFLGNGDGTFQDALTSPTGANPISLAVGDLDGDGNLDLATANAYDVSVLMGTGDGTFAAPNTYYVSYNPSSVAVGDFTGDGAMDLGVTSVYYGYYSVATVLVGNGAGTFSGSNTTEIGYGNFSSAIAVNLDGVGADELVTANNYYGYYYGAVAILSSDGAGSLVVSNMLYTGANAISVAVGDVNADGSMDLVTTDYYSYYYNYSLDRVSVLLGDGAGGFGGAASYPVGSYPSGVVLGDFTGDGNVDIVTANYYGNDVSLLYGDGTGAFSAPVHNSAGSYPWAIVAGEFNGDTWLDAATANLGDNTVSVLINDQEWPGPPPPTVSIGDAWLYEGNVGTTEMTFTVYLSALHNQDVTVQYATAGAGSATAGDDYANTFGEVTIPRGQWSSTFTVTVNGDRVAEQTETFVVNLSAPVNADLGNSQGVGYIYDDEPVIYIDDVSITEGNTGSANATFTVYLSEASDVDVKVHYATANDTATAGSDYTAAAGDLTIPAGQTSKTFTIAVTGDRSGESNETFLVNLTDPVNAGIGDTQAVGTIIDNEPRVSINDVTTKEGNGKSTVMTFTVKLSSAYDQTVTVNFATSSAGGTATAGSDYQAKNGTLTFAAGVTSMTISITILPDKAKESNETFYVNLSGGSSNYFLFDAQGLGTIQDDDNRGKK